MPLLISLLLAWPQLLSSIGVPPDSSAVFFTQGGETPVALQERAAQGVVVVLVGDSPAARALGFIPTSKRTPVRSVIDARQPRLDIVWEEQLDLPVFDVPPSARVFARERWQGAPLLAGLKAGAGGFLWLAASPGARSYDRFPFLPHALVEMGLTPPVRARNLWAFFDSSYRLRVDLEWFAPQWRAAGIAALQVAAWHYWEPDPQRDAWLASLIDVCHRHGILVYAWIEFPHVSERFWNDHPEWREKTAIGQDAHLDWRKLINLTRPDCAQAVALGLEQLTARFDWDGVNLAELYFESLEGFLNPSRFTPMNDDVRASFKKTSGEDPISFFQPDSPRYHGKTADGMRKFLDYRAALAQQLQEEWLARLEVIRAKRPHLDLVLTHVDDRFDTTMRDKIGADAARLLPVAARSNATFLIEDPATIWDLGPQRYPEIARRYVPIAPRPDQLAIDINIAERYQDVYPTKQQAGAELYQLVHLAAQAFPRVALYFESSILRTDWPLLANSSAVVSQFSSQGEALRVNSPRGIGVTWRGGAKVNGRPWPVLDGTTVWLPPGPATVEAGAEPPLRLTDLNGTLRDAQVAGDAIRFRYSSAARAIATFDRVPKQIEVDGSPVRGSPALSILLPKGDHEVLVR